MIAMIKGTVFAVGLDWIIIENQGIGYKVFFSRPEAVRLNQEVRVFTYQHVREDEFSLFGFLSMEEQDLFVKLISVKGLGPKTAMNMLAAATYQQMVQMIEQGDVAALKKMPGIGAKTASQIILDLKGKLVREETNEGTASQAIEDALEALKALGYKQNELSGLSKIMREHPDKTTDEYVKLGLQHLLQRKRGG